MSKFIISLVFLFFFTGCFRIYPNLINNKKEENIKSSCGEVLISSGTYGNLFFIKHRYRNTISFRRDSIKAYFFRKFPNVIEDFLYYEERIPNNTKDAQGGFKNRLFIEVILKQELPYGQILKIPCNYILCDGKALTDTVTICNIPQK